MKELTGNIKFSVKIKIFILIVAIILFMSTSLVIFFFVRSKGELEKEIKKRGIAEIKNLELDVEYAVLTKNITSLSNILKSRLNKPDIVYLEIEGNNGEVLARQNRPEYNMLLKTNEPTINLGSNVYLSCLSTESEKCERIYEFATPIVTEKLMTTEFEEELDVIMMGNRKSEIQYLSSIIGIVKVAISLEMIDKQISESFFISIFIVLFVAIISIFLSSFFINMIVKPIKDVTLTAIEISEGNLEKRVHVNTSDETGILAANFNKMAKSLKSTVENLKMEIAERTQVTNDLQKSEMKYRKLIESANDAILIVNVETGIIIDANKMAEKLLGRNSSEIIGMQQKLFYPKDMSMYYREITGNNLLEEKGPMRIPDEFFVWHKNGRKVPVEVSVSFVDLGDKRIVQGIFRDITERKIMERKLRSTRDHLREIVDNTTAVIYLKDIEGRYILINKRYESLFHIRKKDIVGKTDYDIFPKEIAEALIEHDRNVIETNSPQEMEEIVSHGGRLHTYISLKFPVYDSTDVLYGVCGISTDITERKKAEREILEVEENERNRIGRDLHDGIGQFLTGIFLKTQVLEKTLDSKNLEEEAKEAIEIIGLSEKAIKHTQILAKGLSPLNEDENDFCEMLEEWAYSVKKIHDISCTIDCEQNCLLSDYSVKTNLYRIAQEAINNAIKHAKPKNIAIRFFEKNGMITFQVKDDGKGIVDIAQRKKGLGLRTMKYRANLIGASLDTKKGKNGGTIVNCILKSKDN